MERKIPTIYLFQENQTFDFVTGKEKIYGETWS